MIRVSVNEFINLLEKKNVKKSYITELRFSANSLRDIVESRIIDDDVFAETLKEITGLDLEKTAVIDKGTIEWDNWTVSDFFNLSAIPIKDDKIAIVYPSAQLFENEKTKEKKYVIVPYYLFRNLIKKAVKFEEEEKGLLHEYIASGRITEALFFILIQAVADDISDIHILSVSDIVRFRKDGVIQSFYSLQGKGTELTKSILAVSDKQVTNLFSKPISVRLSGDSILSKKDIISVLDKAVQSKLEILKGVDFRIEVVPHTNSSGGFEASTTIRLLDKTKTAWKLDKLGLQESIVSKLRSSIYRKGIILVTGETGSGKTTTCYALLNEIDAVSHMLITIEDPIEFRNKLWKQLEYKEEGEFELSFSKLLSSVLRQDPDIIFVGEVRDTETARLLFQASNTGHSVISTLHTNSAYDTVMRLKDLLSSEMHEEEVRMKLSSFLKGILSQRLLRKVCKHCKEIELIPKDIYIDVNQRSHRLLDRLRMDRHFVGKGCSKCNHTGYRGRILISEFIEFTPEVSEKMLKGELSKVEFERIMESQGYNSLLADAIKKARTGLIDFYEIARKV